MRRKLSTEEADHLKFLCEAREKTLEQLQNLRKFRRVMQRIVNQIPHEGGKFGQDPLGKSLLRGVPTEEIDWILSEQETEENLRKLLTSFDREITNLIGEEKVPEDEEPPVPFAKPAA